MSSILKWTGRAMLAVTLVLILVAAALFVKGGMALSRTYALDIEAVEVPSDSASLAYGAELARGLGCNDCHGESFSGEIIADVPPFRMVARNLTGGAGGVGASYSDEDLVRAIRHGVRPDGSGLFIMPSFVYYNLSDSDVAAIVAYLRTLPAVDNALPTSEIKPLGRLIAGLDSGFRPEPARMDFSAPRPRMPVRAATAEYGGYRTRTMCTACHGDNLRGGPHPDPDGPLGPDLASVKAWGKDAFFKAIRTGETPSGRVLDDHWMPWKSTRHFSDLELEAMYLHLAAL